MHTHTSTDTHQTQKAERQETHTAHRPAAPCAAAVYVALRLCFSAFLKPYSVRTAVKVVRLPLHLIFHCALDLHYIPSSPLTLSLLSSFLLLRLASLAPETQGP